jgi:hypothetical protein
MVEFDMMCKIFGITHQFTVPQWWCCCDPSLGHVTKAKACKGASRK